MRLAGLRRALVALAAMTGLAVRAVELDPRAGVLGPRAPHARRAHPRHAPKVATRPDGLSPTRSERGVRPSGSSGAPPARARTDRVAPAGRLALIDRTERQRTRANDREQDGLADPAE